MHPPVINELKDSIPLTVSSWYPLSGIRVGSIEVDFMMIPKKETPKKCDLARFFSGVSVTISHKEIVKFFCQGRYKANLIQRLGYQLGTRWVFFGYSSQTVRLIDLQIQPPQFFLMTKYSSDLRNIFALPSNQIPEFAIRPANCH